MTEDLFRIASLSAGPDVEDWDQLSTVLNVGTGSEVQLPEWSYVPYQSFDDVLSGDRVGNGFPVVTWRWKALRPQQREVLRSYCPHPALSGWVYIYTPTNETLMGERIWVALKAKMLWMPADEQVFDAVDLVQQVDLQFRMCSPVVA